MLPFYRELLLAKVANGKVLVHVFRQSRADAYMRASPQSEGIPLWDGISLTDQPTTGEA